MNFMTRWYLLKTKARQEKTAIVNLENQNFHIYCPRAKIDNKIVILFPGYLFIQLDDKTQNWSPICSTKGIQNFVRFGLNYAKVSDTIIDFIRMHEKSSLEKMKNLNNFQIGDKVQISEGVFKNCKAIFKSFKSDERVILMMELMGRQQAVNIKKQSLIRL